MKKLIAILLLAVMAFSLCAFKLPEKSSEDTSSAATYEEAAELFYVQKDYPSTFKLLKSIEKQEYAPALELLGYCYGEGYGTDRDFEKAMALYERAETEGSLLAKFMLGNACEDGRAYDKERSLLLYAQFLTEAEEICQPKNPEYSRLQERPEYSRLLCCMGECYELKNMNPDYEKALECFTLSARLGNSTAIFRLGIMYENGYCVKPNESFALRCYLKAAEQGSYRAMHALGRVYENGNGVERDYGQAKYWYDRAAELGYSGSMCQIGNLYKDGHGVSQDYEKALSWYHKSAELGCCAAMSNLGVMYKCGWGISEPDYEQAMEWFKKAAALDYGFAMLHVGILYEEGWGIDEPDYEQALEWYSKSLDHECDFAETYLLNLGVKYCFGKGVEQSYEKAMECFLKAVEHGDTRAMEYVYWLYENGYCEEQDYQKAIEWYSEANELENLT